MNRCLERRRQSNKYFFIHSSENILTFDWLLSVKIATNFFFPMRRVSVARMSTCGFLSTAAKPLPLSSWQPFSVRTRCVLACECVTRRDVRREAAVEVTTFIFLFAIYSLLIHYSFIIHIHFTLISSNYSFVLAIGVLYCQLVDALLVLASKGRSCLHPFNLHS